MRPTLAKAGRSFLAAGLYYLHDKGHAATSDRVAFTHVANVPTQNAEAALKAMAFTALHQAELKRAHYLSMNPDDPQCRGMVKGGRPVKATVFHYSLSWHPTETPDKAHMIDSAKETLHLLGLSEHQAVMVAHNDAEHPHIHVIVNKVHPKTGAVAKLYKPVEKLHDWRKDYERQRGQDWSVIAVRDRTSLPIDAFNDAHNAAKSRRGSGSKADYYRWKREQSRHDWNLTKQAGDRLWQIQKAERDRLFRMRDAEIKRAKEVVREGMRASWAAHFRHEREQRHRFEQMQAHFAGRLAYFLRHSSECVRHEGGWLTAVWNALANPEKLRGQLEDRLAAEKQVLKDRHGRAVKAAVDSIYERHKARFAALREAQKEQRDSYRKDLADRRSDDAAERFRRERVAEAIAEALRQRVGRRPEETTRPETMPLPSMPEPPRPIVADRAATYSPPRPVLPYAPPRAPTPRGERFAANTNAAGNERENKPVQRTPSRDIPERARPVPPPWAAYGAEPRLILTPKGMRGPPVQKRAPPKPLDRKTLQQLREEKLRQEEAELIQIFGSVAKVRPVRARATNGKVIAKFNGRGRVRRRTFEP